MRKNYFSLVERKTFEMESFLWFSNVFFKFENKNIKKESKIQFKAIKML